MFRILSKVSKVCVLLKCSILTTMLYMLQQEIQVFHITQYHSSCQNVIQKVSHPTKNINLFAVEDIHLLLLHVLQTVVHFDIKFTCITVCHSSMLFSYPNLSCQSIFSWFPVQSESYSKSCYSVLVFFTQKS